MHPKTTLFSASRKIGGLFLILSLVLGGCTPGAPAAQTAGADRYTAAAPLDITSTAAQTPRPAAQTPHPAGDTALPPENPPPATETPTETPSRSLVLISWDAARLDWVEQWMAEGALPHFVQIQQAGMHARSLQSIDPPLTAAAHASLATGQTPDRTGLVSNAFHNANDSLYWYRNAFDEPYGGGEPLWVTAARSGLRTATVAFPGASPDLPGQMAEWTVGYGERLTYSGQVRVRLGAVQEQNLPVPSYSPPRGGEFQIERVGWARFVVVDSQDDGQAQYDRVIFADGNGDFSAHAAAGGAGVGEWSQVVIVGQPLSGADMLIQEISAQEVTLFHSAVYRNKAAPQALLEALDERFGYFAPNPDSYGLEHGWITADDYLYMIERAALWRAQTAAWLYETYHPDLLLVWQETFDSAGHAFAMQDARQAGYTPELAQENQARLRIAARIADAALAEILAPIDLEQTIVTLTGDHGMAAVHTDVFVNTMLEDAGLLVLDNRNYVVVSKSKAFAVASGGSAHVYVNLMGRERAGIVAPVEYEEVVGALVDLFAGLRDPYSGEPVFQRVLRHNELAVLGLDHPNSGDVFLQAYPGYALDGWRGRATVFEPAGYYGQHGYAADTPAMQTIFIAAGGCLPVQSAAFPGMQIIDIAPTLASWLLLPPNPAWQGLPLSGCP